MSHFSAATELLVTAGVFYFFWRAIRFDDFRWPLIWITIGYETLFNITYMAVRLARHDPAPDYPGWATLLLAGHGTLSLIMFLGLIAFVMVAFRQRHVGDLNVFRDHGSFTLLFIVLWTTSIVSGELIYALQLTDVIAV